MKFVCNNCNRRLKSAEATGAAGGGMSVASFCPSCGGRFALLANREEVLLLKALNAGPPGRRLMSQVLELAEATLSGAVDQTPPDGPRPGADWRKMAAEWVWVEPGTFVMGSPESEPGREPDEGPQHGVTIGAGFFLARYVVTRGQWEDVMGTAPWQGRSETPTSPTLPAVFMSWNDVQEFVARLNEGLDDALYRLPSEAEWEYACRAGTATTWSFGEDRHALGDYAWYVESEAGAERQSPCEVGTKLPNPWGLHDMHGNVWEWCRDAYDHGYYAGSPAVDPNGPEAGPGSTRVARGGYFRYFTRHSRSASRNARRPDERHRAVGARLVKEAQ